MVTDPQRAPGDLETVRELLNTEWITNDTRERRDDLEQWLRSRRVPPAEFRELLALRAELRHVVTRVADADATLNRALPRLRVQLAVRKGTISFDHQPGTAAELLVSVLGSIRDGTWHRMKACPDCEWVFFDQSRNASKRWCVMQAESRGGRSCGTLAKVREFRRRAKRSAKRGKSR
jgi:predicted RNA-binding Zn ribbon-like protein